MHVERDERYQLSVQLKKMGERTAIRVGLAKKLYHKIRVDLMNVKASFLAR